MSKTQKIKNFLTENFKETVEQGQIASNSTVQRKGSIFFILTGSLNPTLSGNFSEIMDELEQERLNNDLYR